MTFPRHPLAILPTPLQRLPGLEERLGGGPLYLKRDDLIGFGLAGNKARPLEFLLADALACGAATLVTAGSPSSNFVAAAALAARTAGLGCEILLAGPEPGCRPVTLRLAEHAGARLIFTGADRGDLDELVAEHSARLGAYPVPRGGASPIGALGFARAAEEVTAQLAAAGHTGDAVVVLPTGSGASLAGLLAGRAAIGATWRIHAVSVSRPQVRAEVLRLSAGCAALLGTGPPTGHDLRVTDAIGPGLGHVSERDRRDILLALRSTGVLFDPVYGAKAVSAVLEMRERAPVVLWHTGGLPAALSLLTEAAA